MAALRSEVQGSFLQVAVHCSIARPSLLISWQMTASEPKGRSPAATRSVPYHWPTDHQNPIAIQSPSRGPTNVLEGTAHDWKVRPPRMSFPVPNKFCPKNVIGHPSPFLRGRAALALALLPSYSQMAGGGRLDSRFLSQLAPCTPPVPARPGQNTASRQVPLPYPRSNLQSPQSLLSMCRATPILIFPLQTTTRVHHPEDHHAHHRQCQQSQPVQFHQSAAAAAGKPSPSRTLGYLSPVGRSNLVNFAATGSSTPVPNLAGKKHTKDDFSLDFDTIIAMGPCPRRDILLRSTNINSRLTRRNRSLAHTTRHTRPWPTSANTVSGLMATTKHGMASQGSRILDAAPVLHREAQTDHAAR
ncbi:hypothetical protein K456DRAFT_36092 [Colletotrichum gloeosporioides 23]|nr:hypothetical protein K456DRAFT_36092 [Colletotrichum gloeosporioides 23]